MTVSSSTSKVTYSGNGVTTAFAFSFPIQVETDLRVVLRASSGTETVLALTTDYTVSASPWTTGGTVTLITPPASGETLLVKRQVPVTQLTDLRDADIFPAESVEAVFDKLTYIAQQLAEIIGRNVTLQEVSLLTGLTLPDPAAGTVLYSADGLTLQWALLGVLGGGSVPIPLSIANGGTGSTTAPTARVALGENASGSFFTRKHNFAASAAPTTTDDTNAGYSVGAWWFDTTNDVVYTCIDATASAAIWTVLVSDRGPAFKNRITNGDIAIDQRNAGSAVTVNTTGTFFGPDVWRGFGANADGVFTIARSTATPPAGFSHFLRATVTTADASIGASQTYGIATFIEGFNMLDAGFGAAGAQSVTLSFRVRSSLTGTFSGALANGAGNRTYPFSFTINAANTWETKTVTIAGDTSGTWPTDSSQWGKVYFDLGAGTSVRAAANAWTATSGVIGVTGAASLISTLSATFDVTGVQLELGSRATEFERLPYGEKQRRCMRYYQRMVTGEAVERQTAPYVFVYSSYSNAGGVNSVAFVSLAVPMRATPTAARIGSWTLSNIASQPTVGANNPQNVQFTAPSTAAGATQATPGAATGYDLAAEL